MGGFKDRLIARIFTRLPFLVERAAEKSTAIKVEGVPWTPFTKGLGDATIALVTTAGVHLRDQPPFDMNDPDGDASFRVIPADAPREALTITHDYYDHRDADRDINIVFPIDRLFELKKEGLIGGVAKEHYGFMGHIDGPHIETLMKKTAPEAAERIREAGVDAVLLTPG